MSAAALTRTPIYAPSVDESAVALAGAFGRPGGVARLALTAAAASGLAAAFGPTIARAPLQAATALLALAALVAWGRAGWLAITSETVCVGRLLGRRLRIPLAELALVERIDDASIRIVTHAGQAITIGQMAPRLLAAAWLHLRLAGHLPTEILRAIAWPPAGTPMPSSLRRAECARYRNGRRVGAERGLLYSGALGRAFIPTGEGDPAASLVRAICDAGRSPQIEAAWLAEVVAATGGTVLPPSGPLHLARESDEILIG